MTVEIMYPLLHAEAGLAWGLKEREPLLPCNITYVYGIIYMCRYMMILYTKVAMPYKLLPSNTNG